MNFIKKYSLWIALAVLLLPIALRAVWFYQGIPIRPKVNAPNYTANLLPTAPFSTPAAGQVTMTVGRTVVIDNQHNNQFIPNQIDTFVSALSGRGARVEIDNGDLPLSVRLKYASTYVVFSPTAGFTAAEVNQVRNFVSDGGRLIVFTDPTHGINSVDYFSGTITIQPDVDYANNLLAPYGLTVRNDYLYDLAHNEGNFRNVLFDHFGKDPLTTGLSSIAFYGANSISVNSGTALIIGDSNTFSSQTDTAGSGMVAAALSADGNVLSLGDSSFLIPPYNQMADNSLLVGHIADFALGGTRTHSVADFPYVFDRTAYLVPVGEVKMTSELLGPISGLQNALRSASTSLLLRDTAPANGDLLILGTLSSSEDLLPYIAAFNLGLDDPTTLSIPEFGTIDRSEVGLLLYRHTSGRNTLVVLADSATDIPALIDLLTSGSLESCVLQGQVGVCNLGSGSSGSSFPLPTFDFPSLDTPTPEATPSG
jgi:hypothetical protein